MEKSMTRRMVVMLVAVVGLLGLIGGVKYRQLQAGAAAAAAFRPPPEAVTTVRSPEARWPVTLSAIGTVAAVRGVTVSADLPGVVSTLAFESGQRVKQGQLLARLDSRQEQAQLQAAESHRELTQLRLQRAKILRAQGSVAQQALDVASAEDAQAAARVGEIRAVLERKQLRAPFAGVLGLRQVNVGQYLGSGQPVVALQALDQVHVNFAVPQQEVLRLEVGDTVEVYAEGLERTLEGRLTALDAVVDEATRSVQVQATVDNGEGLLRPGMFVNVRVRLGPETRVVTLPASAIHHAPYGDSIFVVSELQGPGGEKYRGVRQQPVKLGGSRGDQVAVLSGLEAGQEVVTSGTFKLRNGAAILVNNQLQPGNDPAARPENN
jgi:membrane fusion protein, multidrug efflux system